MSPKRQRVRIRGLASRVNGTLAGVASPMSPKRQRVCVPMSPAGVYPGSAFMCYSQAIEAPPLPSRKLEIGFGRAFFRFRRQPTAPIGVVGPLRHDPAVLCDVFPSHCVRQKFRRE